MIENDKFEKQNEIKQNAIAIKEGIALHFGAITDPKRSFSITYKLLDILFMALCAVLSGADRSGSSEFVCAHGQRMGF